MSWQLSYRVIEPRPRVITDNFVHIGETVLFSVLAEDAEAREVGQHRFWRQPLTVTVTDRNAQRVVGRRTRKMTLNIAYTFNYVGTKVVSLTAVPRNLGRRSLSPINLEVSLRVIRQQSEETTDRDENPERSRRRRQRRPRRESVSAATRIRAVTPSPDLWPDEQRRLAALQERQRRREALRAQLSRQGSSDSLNLDRGLSVREVRRFVGSPSTMGPGIDEQERRSERARRRQFGPRELARRRRLEAMTLAESLGLVHARLRDLIDRERNEPRFVTVTVGTGQYGPIRQITVRSDLQMAIDSGLISVDGPAMYPSSAPDVPVLESQFPGFYEKYRVALIAMRARINFERINDRLALIAEIAEAMFTLGTTTVVRAALRRIAARAARSAHALRGAAAQRLARTQARDITEEASVVGRAAPTPHDPTRQQRASEVIEESTRQTSGDRGLEQELGERFGDNPDFSVLNDRLGLDPPRPQDATNLTYRQRIRTAFDDAVRAGFVNPDGSPRNVGTAVQPHNRAPLVREATGTTGAIEQSAHIGATSLLRKLPGYSRGYALTRNMPIAAHRSFDRHWLNWIRQQRARSIETTSLQEVLNAQRRALRQTHGLRRSELDALEVILEQEIMTFAAQQAGGLTYRVPLPNVR